MVVKNKFSACGEKSTASLRRNVDLNARGRWINIVVEMISVSTACGTIWLAGGANASKYFNGLIHQN
jgi:hypothetical protein